MDWLSQIFERIFSFIPRFWYVMPDESGVRITLGSRVTTTPPGWYGYWPLIQECEKIKVKTQIKDLRAQSVWTKDHVELTVSGAIRYRVRDARLAILNCYDYDNNVQAVGLGIIEKYIFRMDESEIDTNKLAEEILAGVKQESRGWGLDIEQVFITDIGRTQNLRLLTNGPLIVTAAEGG